MLSCPWAKQLPLNPGARPQRRCPLSVTPFHCTGRPNCGLGPRRSIGDIIRLAMMSSRNAGTHDAVNTHERDGNGEGSHLLRNLTHKPNVKTKAVEHHDAPVVGSRIRTAEPAPVPAPNPSGSKESDMDERIHGFLEALGPDRFTFYVYLGLLSASVASVVGFFLLSWSWITAIICVFIAFVIWRHISIKRNRPRPQTGQLWISRRHPSTPVPDTSHLPAVYFLYVLGSGGHTTEMLDTIRHKFYPQANQHRRYLVTTGDQDSLDRVFRLEQLIHRCFPDGQAGTIDTFQVPRARRVHQPLWTAPFTCLATAVHAVNALTREPDRRPQTRHGAQFKYPHVVVTNGPATGFVVCLVAHLLKVFYLAPHNRLKMVYVESWARSRSLSLTGRLFRWTGVADVFCVQHRELARRTPGAVYVGQVAARFAPPGYRPRAGDAIGDGRAGC